MMMRKYNMKKICSFVISAVLISQSFTSFASVKDRSEQLETLSGLFAECEDKGIGTDYQQLAYNIIERFAGYQEDDAENSEPEARISYNEEALDKLYNNAVTELNAYLDGKEYSVTDGISNYSIGHLYMGTPTNEIPNFEKFGADNVSYEIGPEYVITGYGGWEEKVSGTANSTEADGYMFLTANEGASVTLSQPIYLKQGHTYTIGYEYKGNVPNTGTLKVGIQGSESGAPYIAVGDEDVWKTRTEKTYTASATGEHTFVISVQSKTTGIYIDNIYVKDENDRNIIGDAEFENETVFDIDYDYIEAKVNDVLEAAKEAGIKVHLLLSPHYFPDFVMEDNPDMVGQCGFLEYNIMHPAALSVIEAYLCAVFSVIDDYSALESIILSNEVIFTTNIFGDFYREDFNSYLEKIHGSVANMNNNYGKWLFNKYDSYSDVPMTSQAKAEGYDYINFNEDVLTGWHEWMKNIIRNYTDTPVSIKMISNLTSTDPYVLAKGTDAEKFARVTDWAGHDAIAYYDMTTMDKMGKHMWYDYLKSTTGQIVYNSEDHIIADGSSEYSEKQMKHVENDMWQGAVHGRDITSIWVWNRTHDSDHPLYASILTRPDCVYAVGKTAYDLDRVSEEVSVLANSSPKVAILCSKASRLYDAEDYISSLNDAYYEVQKAGYKVGFVSELSIDKISTYDILVIPRVVYEKASVVEKIENFISDGGRVIRTFDGIFAYDEYGQSNTNNIASNSTLASESGILKKELLNNSNITMSSDDIIYQTAENNGIYYVNLCNYAVDTENEIYVNDKKVIRAKELITGEIYDGTVKTETPTLIEIKAGTPKEVANLAAQDKLLVWEETDNMAEGFNIYSEDDLVATVYENSYAVSEYGMYTVKAFNSLGEESVGSTVLATMFDEMLSVIIDKSVNVAVTNYYGQELCCNIEIAGYDEEDQLVSLSGVKVTIPISETIDLKTSLYEDAVRYIVSVKDCAEDVVYAVSRT